MGRWGHGLFCVARGNRGRAGPEGPHVPYLRQAWAKVGVTATGSLSGWSANSASRPGARPPPRRCLCRKSRRTMSGLLRTRKIGGQCPLRPIPRPANHKGLVPLCLPRRKAPATSITTQRMPTASSSTKGRPARQAGAKQRGTSSFILNNNGGMGGDSLSKRAYRQARGAPSPPARFNRACDRLIFGMF